MTIPVTATFPDEIIIWRNTASDGTYVLELLAMHGGEPRQVVVVPAWAGSVFGRSATDDRGVLYEVAPLEQTTAPVLVGSGFDRTGPLVEVLLPIAIFSEVASVVDDRIGRPRPVLMLQSRFADESVIDFLIPLDQDLRYQDVIA